jgi:replicative DNA helicase
MTSGLQRNDLIIIAARPSMGKTSLCLTIAQNAAILEKAVVAVFSLEMSKEQLVMRMLSSEAKVDAHRFRSGFLTRDEWGRLAESIGILSEAKIFIDDTPGISVLEMRAKARRLATEQKKLDLIVVDYMQLMSGSRRTESRQQEVSQISRELKGLAKELNVPLIALSQLSRAPEARNPPRPLMSDLRESGSIEQDADVVTFIYRDEYYKPSDENKGLAELLISKQRNGPTGTVKLAFLKEFTRFEDSYMP